MWKYKYRGLLTLGLMLMGSLFVISTISGLLDRSMRRKPPVAVEAYVPPSAPPIGRPQALGSRNQLRAERG